ncbi:hypothetical protein POTOM_046724 [Populus tomentosa]|uniref:Uncharacterized protein n=1 Tax=Populus tomentosa TaxID=118781 RepID=A0A8X7YJM8_POPTO|nr:hypothetical protein POTOM_046724 [Populus tomentosa]
MAFHALLLKRHMLFKKMGMTQGDGTYLEGDLALEGTGEDWKLDVEWHMPCSHRRMMELAYIWSLGPLFGIQGKQGTREFSGSELNFNLARYATSDQAKMEMIAYPEIL